MTDLRKTTPAILCAMALTGCASQLLSDERIISNTAGVLGVPPADLTISDRRTEATNTYYIARTRNGASYACTINGGNALTFGMVNSPFCTAQTTNGMPGQTYGRRGLGG
jgi:hypothetical protein